MQREIDRLQTEKAEPQELEKIKNKFEANTLFGEINVMNKAMNLGFYQMRRQPAQRQHRQPAERRFVCFYHSSSPHVRKSLNSVSIVYFPQFVKRHPTMIL